MKTSGIVQSGAYAGQQYFVMGQSEFNERWRICNLIDRRARNLDLVEVFAQREIHERDLEASREE